MRKSRFHMFKLMVVLDTARTPVIDTRNFCDKTPHQKRCARTSPRCLGERPNKTLNVLKQKENDVSACVTMHSETANDDASEYGQGPETSSAAETSTAYPQFFLKAQFRMRTHCELPANRTSPPLASGKSSRTAQDMGKTNMRMWRNQKRCVDAERPRMECNSRCIFDPCGGSSDSTVCTSPNLTARSDMENLRPLLRVSLSSNITRSLKRSFQSSWFGASKGINLS